MPIAVSPLSEAIGARIEGVDLSRALDAETFGEIQGALFEHAIIVVPGQTLGEDDQERFCRYSASSRWCVPARRWAATIRGAMITNVRDTGRPTALEDGEMMFHYDQCYYENPALGSTLYAIEIPDQGGNTLFANCRLAYEALDAEWKARLDGLRAAALLRLQARPRAPAVGDQPRRAAMGPSGGPHPPRHRAQAIYVNRLMTLWIEGIERAGKRRDPRLPVRPYREAGIRLRTRLVGGELVMWDNRCSAHARTWFSPEKRRMMRRVTVRDPYPVS